MSEALTICTVSYNTRDLLERCLLSVLRDPAAERGDGEDVRVLDNASSDGSAEMVAGEFPTVHLIRQETNIGYTRGMNVLLQAAPGRFVLLLNPDTELLDKALVNLEAALIAHPRWAAAGARLEFPDGTLQRTGNRFLTRRDILYDVLGINARLPDNATLLKHQYGDWDRHDEREVDALSGACLMVRRSVIEKIGLLDEQFPMYFEEVDWCRRMRDHGWKIGYVPDARVRHSAEASARQLPDAQRTRLYETSLVHFADKYYGATFATLVRGILSVRHAARRVVRGSG